MLLKILIFFQKNVLGSDMSGDEAMRLVKKDMKKSKKNKRVFSLHF